MLSFGVGALLACAFAPLQWWPLAILCPAALMWLWEEAAPREAAWTGFWFSFGTFLAGTYWLYVSVHDLGGAPVWMTIGIMLGLIGIMALYNALIGYTVARLLPRSGAWRWLVGMPAVWLLIEWLRGWFLSGFSWLSLGYSQTDTWLARFAPLLGVYGISLLLLTSAGALVALIRGDCARASDCRAHARRALGRRRGTRAGALDAPFGRPRLGGGDSGRHPAG